MDTKQKHEKTAKAILLSGFLGAGKTTLLKHIISLTSDISDTVIILNEFGKIGIDGMLLNNADYEVVTLANGCICCSLAMDLKKQIKSIKKKFNPRHIFIEASGVADPGTIVATLREREMPEIISLFKVITVLDAECWKMRDIFGTLFFNQLKTADMILLNKIDQHDKKAITEFINEIHDAFPSVQVIPTMQCGIDSDMLWAETSPEKGKPDTLQIHDDKIIFSDSGIRRLHSNEETKNIIAKNEGYVSFSFKEKKSIDEAEFKKIIRDVPFELFRIKGIVCFPDRTEFLNFVGGKAHWSAWQETDETYLEFTGWDIASEKMLEKLEGCILR